MRAGLGLIADPGPDRLRDVAASAPDNPFLTPEYAAARRSVGEQVILLDATGPDEAPTLAFLRRGWRGCSLRIDSIPPWPASSTAWQALLDYCAMQAVTLLEIESFASIATDIPRLGAEPSRRAREEFMMHLTADHEPDLSSQHRRNIARARKAELATRHGADPALVRVHTSLMAESLDRHAARGEAVPARVDHAGAEALVRCGAAEIHEAVSGATTLASVLVLRSARAGYYHSAGSTDAGRACGAATFLVLEVARSLAERGADTFHLGGASTAESGLRRFKTGFGADARALEAVTTRLSPTPARRAMGIWRRILRHR